MTASGQNLEDATGISGVTIDALLLPFYVMFLGGMFDEMYGKISTALEALR